MKMEKKGPCICENYKSTKLAAMNFQIMHPKSNIFHVVIQAQAELPTDADNEDISGITSGILSEAFLRGRFKSLTVSDLVEKFMKFTHDAHALEIIRMEFPRQPSSDPLGNFLSPDVITAAESPITSLHSFKLMVDKSLLSLESHAMILVTPTNTNPSFALASQMDSFT